jgi:histidine triad (HIT) family protein
MQANCIFCKIIAGIIPSTIIDQNEHVIVIKDIAPQTPIHYLIIPKVHVENIKHVSQNYDHMLSALLLMAQKLGAQLPEPQEYRLKINNGFSVGQRVFHLHMHFLAGTELPD